MTRVLGDHHARRDAHGHELLEEELAGVGYAYLRDLRLVLAAAALVGLLLELRDGDQAAEVAHVHTIRVGDLEQALLEELGGAVRYLTVALHLAEAQTAVARSALHGLSVEDLDGSARPRVYLVVDHVLEALIVGRSEEDLRVELAAGEAVVHDLVAAQLVVVAGEELGDLVHGDGVVEGRRVAYFALVGAHLRLNALDQVTDGHATGNGVRVDDEIGRDALAREGHVLHAIEHAAGALLTVTRGELVADLRRLDGAHLDFDELVALVAHAHEHLVDDARLGGAQERAHVLFRVALWRRHVLSFCCDCCL